MKKLFTAAVALICITMVAVSLTACGDDDNELSPVLTRTLSKVEVCYIVHMPYNGRQICDYIVSYTEADGKEKTGMLVDTAWVKRITITDFPFTATINMNAQRNENELKDSIYDFHVYYSIYSITSIYSDGTKEENYKDVFASHSYVGSTLKAEKAEAYIEELLPKRLKAKSVELSTDGKILSFLWK